MFRIFLQYCFPFVLPGGPKDSCLFSFPTVFSFRFIYNSFLLFLTSSSTCLNHRVLGRPTSLFPLNQMLFSASFFCSFSLNVQTNVVVPVLILPEDFGFQPKFPFLILTFFVFLEYFSETLYPVLGFDFILFYKGPCFCKER